MNEAREMRLGDSCLQELQLMGDFIKRAIQGPETPLKGLGDGRRNLIRRKGSCLLEVLFGMLIQLYWKEGNEGAGLDDQIRETYEQIKGLLEAYSKSFPFSGRVLGLELERAYLYLIRNRRAEWELEALRVNILKNLKQCEEILKSVPYHERVIDAYGFFANLFFKSHLAMEGGNQRFMPDADRNLIKTYLDKSLAERKAAYHINPVNIWNIRGLAWSEHVLGRYLMVENETVNINDVNVHMKKAIGIREAGLKIFKHRGLFEDALAGQAEISRWLDRSGNKEERLIHVKAFKRVASGYLNMDKNHREIQERSINRISKKYGVGILVRIDGNGRINWVEA